MAKISKKKVNKSNFGNFPGARLPRNQVLGLPPPNFIRPCQNTQEPNKPNEFQPTKVSVSTSTSELCPGLHKSTSVTSLDLNFENLVVSTSKGQFSDVSDSEENYASQTPDDPHYKFKRYEKTTTISSTGPDNNIPTSSTYFSLLTVGLGRGLGRGVGKGKQYRADFKTTENDYEGLTDEHLVNTNVGRGKSPGHFRATSRALSFDQLPDGKRLKGLSLHPSTESSDKPSSKVQINGLSTSSCSSHPYMVISD